jgi:ribosome-binding factor A
LFFRLPAAHPPRGSVTSDILIRFYFGVIQLEKRGQKYHRERLGEALREEIETILEGELGDPRIGLANVSEVHLAPDSRSARVMVVVEGDDAESEATMQGLQAASGYIRRELAERLQLRRPPELIFIQDRSQEYEARIDELLSRSKKKSRSTSARRA